MDFIKQYLYIILFGMAALVAAAFIIYSFVRSDEEDEDEDEEGGLPGSPGADTQDIESDDMRARKSRMMALKDSLDRSLQTRAGVKAAGGIDRLAMPWFMLVGAEGSGKKSLLASTGLPLPYGPPVEVDSSKRDAGRWWLFEEAVVVEAPAVKPAPKALAPSEATAPTAAISVDSSEGWNNLLHLLRRERPDSPLNGIVIVISCADLVGSRRKSPEELTEQAELIRAFLDRTRKVLGVRLPVHILVNRCDTLPGFRSFTETLPEARREDVFGWANPRPLEKPFDPAWVGAGFVEVQKSLELLHDELLAAQENVEDADGLFVFVQEFRELEDPLVDFIGKLIPVGERRPSLFLRGVYFTGDPSETAARANDENATLHISAEATEAEAHSLVFLRRLFADKIFQEAGLARTAAPIRISRDFRVLGAQAAALLIALLGGAGLWASLYGFSRGGETYGAALTKNASELRQLMSGVAIDLDQARRVGTLRDTSLERRVQDAAVINLVNEMRNVSSRKVRSVFVPSSWFSSLPKSIDSTMVAGVQNIVLPVSRQRLQTRIGDLLGSNGHGPVIINELDTSDPKSLATYLGEVRRLNRAIAQFNVLASPDSGSTADLAGLVEYVYGERLAELNDTTAVSDEFERALRVAQVPKVIITPAQTNAVVSHAVGLVTAIADSSTRQLTGRGSTSPDDDLRALRRLRELADLTDKTTGLVTTIRDSSPSGTRVARAVQDSIGARLSIVATSVLRDTLLADQAAVRLRSVLTSLFAMRLMEPIEGRQIEDELRPGTTMRWDVGQLELALALRGEQRRAQIAATDAFMAATQARLRSAFDNQLRGRLIDLVAGAQRFTPDTMPALNDIRATTANIEAAGDRLTKLSGLLDSLRFGSEGKKLYTIGTRQAEHVLALAQSALDSAKYFAPHPTVVVQWRGGFPIGFAALGVTDTGAFDLRLNQEQIPPVQNLAAAVVPALTFLSQPVITSSMISSPKLISDWRGIVAAAGPEVRTATLLGLVEYLRTTLGPIDQPGCQAAALRPEPPRPVSDWFTMRRTQFRGALLGRCHPGGSGDALASYDRLRTIFTTKLAGRFPFVDSARAATASDADPSAVREFYQMYDVFARSHDVMLRSDPRVGPGARPAFAFLDQMADARQFFAPFVDSATTNRTPEYGFVIEPLGAGETAELKTGPQVLQLNDSTQFGAWGAGEEIALTAGDSSKTALRYSGAWALVKLGTMQRKVRVRYYHPDTKVRLKLPVFPMVAPEIPRPGR